MLRFLLSILIFGAIIWGIFSFFNPLAKLANTFEKAPDEYTKLLTEAVERNNPDAENVAEIFGKRENADEAGEESDEGNTDASKDGKETLGNRAFLSDSFYNVENVAQSGSSGRFGDGIVDIKDVETLSYKNPSINLEGSGNTALKNVRDLYGKTQGTRGYFGTPPLPSADRAGGFGQSGGIIFDPPLSPPKFPNNMGQMMFGKYTVIKGPDEF